jgi:seryl-tRNA synthetase
MKVKLTLGEILNLDIELSGYVNPENGEQILNGLFSQELSLVTKFKLSELRDLIAPLKKNVEELKNDIIKSKGEEKDGTVSIPMMIDDVVNPVFLEFQEEYNKLISEEKELEISEFKIEDFDIVTNESYNTFFKIIKAQQ